MSGGDVVPKTPATEKVAVDSSSPLFLHASDHPGAILVTKPLNGDNYLTWCRLMTIALSAKNKTGFINGTIQKPATGDENFASWQRCNDMVLSWILNSIDPSLGDSVINTESVSKVWNDLKERFSQHNASRIFQTEREIASLNQGDMSVAAYFSKLKGLWDELGSYYDITPCECGAKKKVEEKEQRSKLMQFLMGLHETYSAIRGQILLMEPLPSIGRVYSMVLQEEKQRDVAILREPVITATRKYNMNTSNQGKNKGK